MLKGYNIINFYIEQSTGYSSLILVSHQKLCSNIVCLYITDLEEVTH